jgi:hypothetical protein
MQTVEFTTVGKQVANVLKRYSIARAAIFGSFARGDENKHSDIDILIESSQPISLFQLLRMEEELQWITKRKIDIVEYAAIKKSIRKNILKDAISIL